MQQNGGSLFVNGVVQIVSAHVQHNSVSASEVPDLMRSVTQALVECVQTAAAQFGGQSAPAPVAALAAPAQQVAPAPAPAAKAAPAAKTAPAPAAKAAPAPKAPAPAKPQPVQAKAAPAPAKAASKPAAKPAPKPAQAAAKAAPVPTATTEPVDPRQRNLPTTPAVPVADSVQSDGVICLFDGEKRLMLHRYIKAKWGMSPEQYRKHWDLPADYPMTSPNYSDEKRIVAVHQGLGTPKLYEGVKAREAAAAKAASKGRKAKQNA